MKKLLMALVDFFYPPVCPSCNNCCDESGFLCDDCRKEAQLTRVYQKVEHDWQHLDGVIVLAHYRGGLQNVLHKIKFLGQKDLVTVLKNELEILWQLSGQETFLKLINNHINKQEICVIPVPTDSIRRKNRGYDLPEEIFKSWCENNKYSWQQCLQRTKETKPQFELSGIERKRNISGVMQTTWLPKEEVIILVDDILTTGATLEECARALKENGSENKYIIGIALASDAEK